MPLKNCFENNKDGWKWGDEGKCYTGKDSKKEAIRQGISIEGPENFSKIMKSQSDEQLYSQLSSDEKALADSLLSLVDKIGPIDKSEGIWVGYENANKNEVKDIGVKCGNCALHKSENSCKILSQTIELDGACRFAVIPDGYVNAAKVKKHIEEYLNENNSKQ
jgi:hypothetical protein